MSAEQIPFNQEQHGADAEDERDDPRRPEAGQETAGGLRRRDGQERRRDDEIRETRDVKPREKERVSNRIGRDLLGDQCRSDQRRNDIPSRRVTLRSTAPSRSSRQSILGSNNIR